MKTVVRNAKEWHVGDSDYPKENVPVYILVEEDCFTPTEPELLEAFITYKPENVGSLYPSVIWNIPQDDGTVDIWSIAGGSSVYAWRYKHQVVDSWNDV